MMILEHKFEIKTRGLVCGPTIFVEDCWKPKYFQQHLKFNRQQKIILADPLPRILPPGPGWKVVVKSHESGEIIWSRPYENEWEAQRTYLNLIGVDIERIRLNNRPYRFPTTWREGEFVYIIAATQQYTTTANNSGTDWGTGSAGTAGTRCPSGVTAADYLFVAGGGSGSTGGTGGGGAGGVKSGTALAVTATTNYPVTIGAGGATQAAAAVGNDGNDSTWNSQTALKGGGGGYVGNGTGGSGTYGSGGGAGRSAALTGGAGTAGQGNAGGNTSGDNQGGGGGGGAGAVGANGTSSAQGGAGGNGTASSISGSSVTYGGGGGGNSQGNGGGTGGTGGGGASGNPGTAGTANLGGGGGAGANAGGSGGAGGSGVGWLSWTASSILIQPNSPMLGM